MHEYTTMSAHSHKHLPSPLLDFIESPVVPTRTDHSIGQRAIDLKVERGKGLGYSRSIQQSVDTTPQVAVYTVGQMK